MAIATGTLLLAAAAAAAGGAVAASTAKSNAKASQPAPSYSDSTNQGVTDDAGSLALRLQINQAAQNGTVYTDPATGKVYDFRGTFDADRFFAAHPQAKKEWDDERAKGELQGWTEQQFAQAFMGDNPGAVTQFMTGSQAYRNNTDIANAQQLNTAGLAIQDQSLNNQLNTYLRMMPQFNALNLQSQVDATQAGLNLLPQIGTAQRDQDTLTFNNNLALGQNAAKSNAALQSDILPGVNNLSLNMQQDAFNRTMAANQQAFAGNLNQADTAAARAVTQQQSTLPTLNNLSLALQSDALKAGDVAGRAVNGGLYGIRDEYARGLMEELKAGAELTPAQRRKVQQRIRGAQASRGNILGDGAAFDEAIAESDYAQGLVNDRRSAALGLLNARDLNPNFSALGVVNPTQVVSPNLGPANFSATTAVNPLMPNFAPATSPNLTATTAAMPSAAPANIATSNPLGLLNPNAGNNAANYNLNAWNSLSNRIANLPNPWAQGIGTAASVFGALG